VAVAFVTGSKIVDLLQPADSPEIEHHNRLSHPGFDKAESREYFELW